MHVINVAHVHVYDSGAVGWDVDDAVDDGDDSLASKELGRFSDQVTSLSFQRFPPDTTLTSFCSSTNNVARLLLLCPPKATTYWAVVSYWLVIHICFLFWWAVACGKSIGKPFHLPSTNGRLAVFLE